LRGDERVRPSTATQIDDTLAVFQTAKCERVRDAGERIGGCVGNVRELGWIVEVLGPGRAQWEKRSLSWGPERARRKSS